MLTIKELKEDYNWSCAMKHAKFHADDIDTILKYSEGENETKSWLLLVLLKNGRFGFLTAGCDYTGWD